MTYHDLDRRNAIPAGMTFEAPTCGINIMLHDWAATPSFRPNISPASYGKCDPGRGFEFRIVYTLVTPI